MNSKTAFSRGWTPIEYKETVVDGNYFTFREWQEECFNDLQDSNYWIINAPTASGKSFGISAILADYLMKNPNMKAIIAVPQTIIASGFRLNFIELPDGSRIDFVPQHDLCRNSADSNVDYIISFLSGATDKTNINDRILLCSHASLVASFKKNPNSYTNVAVIVDEAHHARNAELESVEDQIISNSLGAVVTHAIQNPDKNIHIGLSTATFFRGDRLSIIPSQYSQLFDRFDLPYDEFLKTCKYLRHFKYDFVFYQHSYKEALDELFKDGTGKSIVYIPSVGGRYTVGDKNDDVLSVIKSIAQNNNPEIIDEDKPIMKIKRGDEWISVINLVDENLREEKKDAIDQDHKSPESEIDVIITLNMFKEGASWKWADNSIIIGAKNSLNEVIQIIGRLFRDCEGKESVEVYQLLPLALDMMDSDEAQETLNNYLKAVFLSMMLEDILAPVSIKWTREKDGDDKPAPPRKDYIREVFDTESQVLDFYEEVRDRFLELVDEQGVENVKFIESLNNVVFEILSEDGIEEYHKEIANHIRKLWTRRTLSLQGVDVEEIDFDIIQENVNPLGFLLEYTSSYCGVDTFRGLREALPGRVWLPFEEAKAFVHNLNLENQKEWSIYSRTDRPNNIPGNPYKIYQNNGWINWGDWLGTSSVRKKDFLTFIDARNFVRSLGLNGNQEWREYSKSGERPENIPSSPERVYKDQGWVNWGDFLGTGNIKPGDIDYLPFGKAREFAHSLKLKSQMEWNEYCQSGERPENIPASPEHQYKNDGWTTWSDFLGNGYIPNHQRIFLSFENTKKFARSLGLKGDHEWREYWKTNNRPNNIPANPSKVYKDKGWVNWPDFLGTGNIPNKNRVFLSFKDAREFARFLKLKKQKEWFEYCKSGNRPNNIPSNPQRTYKDKGWISWPDFLGTDQKGDVDDN